MRTLAIQLGRMAILILLAGIASGLLLRYSPGSLVDERELNPHLNQASVAALRAQREAENGLLAALVQYLQGLAHGELGRSSSRNAPIAELVRENLPVTVRRIGIGLAAAWFVGFGLAIPVARFRRAWVLDATTSLLAALLLSIPATVLAYFCLTAGTAVETVLVLVLVPRIFRFSRNLLLEGYAMPCVDMARARGVRESTILVAYVIRSAAPQLVVLTAASLSMAVGAIIPIEAICDAAGLGRLAWQAATARDLLLLVNLTMLIALATTAAMAVSELASRRVAEAHG